MKAPAPVQNLAARFRQKPLLLGAVAVAALVVAIGLFKATRAEERLVSYYEVKRGDFLISIVEGGTIEAVSEKVVRSEVEGTARIVFIVPEGSTVKKGDPLVRLDSSSMQDAVNQQQINVEKAQFALVQAQQQLEIQKSLADSEVSAAKLKLELSKLDLEKYLKGEAQQLRRNAEIEITNVLESLQIAEERLVWTEELYKKGFETKNNLDKDRLAVSQNRLKLEQSQKALWMLTSFDEQKKKRTLESTVQEDEENLARVKLQGERKIEQFQADVETQKSTLELSKKKLERDQKQLEATTITAPQDGLVVYAGGGDRRFSSESFIEEGAVVRYRQELIKLPDIAEMKLLVKIHESHVNQVRLDQPAYVVLDAMPDRRFSGAVNRVAPLPDSQSRWGNPNLKVYVTEILVTEPLPNVKPGVSARAEIIITNLEKVLTVPIQAVTTRRGQQVVFLETDPDKPVPVKVGLYNTKFIEIASGLKEGDRVMLSPPFDAEEKDLGGSIVAEGEKPPVANGTNQARRLARPAADDDEDVRSGKGNGNGGRQGGQNNGMSFGPRGNGTGPGGPGVPGGGAGRGEGGGNRGPRFNPEEMLKQFDLNKNGVLDEEERAAMKERFGRERRRSGGATNAPSPGGPGPSDGNR